MAPLTFYAAAGSIHWRTSTGTQVIHREIAEGLRETFAQACREAFPVDKEAALTASRLWLQITSALDDHADWHGAWDGLHRVSVAA